MRGWGAVMAKYEAGDGCEGGEGEEDEAVAGQGGARGGGGPIHRVRDEWGTGDIGLGEEVAEEEGEGGEGGEGVVLLAGGEGEEDEDDEGPEGGGEEGVRGRGREPTSQVRDVGHPEAFEGGNQGGKEGGPGGDPDEGVEPEEPDGGLAVVVGDAALQEAGDVLVVKVEPGPAGTGGEAEAGGHGDGVGCGGRRGCARGGLSTRKRAVEARR